mmetsp:Transcript_22110/g.77490  ORF Transcript_22110/g.77490 Transcript_22110/m.77490 type:complete len:85 (+) Transcript_22110:428-682(+)
MARLHAPAQRPSHRLRPSGAHGGDAARRRTRRMTGAEGRPHWVIAIVTQAEVGRLPSQVVTPTPVDAGARSLSRWRVRTPAGAS